MREAVPDGTLAEMAAYYRERAAEYDEWFYRRGRFDRGSATNARWSTEAALVFAALDDLRPAGEVLELAPGTGIWTARLARTARTITAVDASPEMMAINRAKVGAAQVSYVLAALFTWRPDRQYDAVCFCFWISHVPDERLDTFLQTVRNALKPGGTVFFVDGRREPTSTAADHRLPEPESQIMTRKLNDGRSFQVVKIFWEPQELEARCAAAGLNVVVRTTDTYFIYGSGTRIPQA